MEANSICLQWEPRGGSPCPLSHDAVPLQFVSGVSGHKFWRIGSSLWYICAQGLHKRGHLQNLTKIVKCFLAFSQIPFFTTSTWKAQSSAELYSWNLDPTCRSRLAFLTFLDPLESRRSWKFGYTFHRKKFLVWLVRGTKHCKRTGLLSPQWMETPWMERLLRVTS